MIEGRDFVGVVPGPNFEVWLHKDSPISDWMQDENGWKWMKVLYGCKQCGSFGIWIRRQPNRSTPWMSHKCHMIWTLQWIQYGFIWIHHDSSHEAKEGSVEEPSQTKLRDATSLGRGKVRNWMWPPSCCWNRGSNENLELWSLSSRWSRLVQWAHSITHPPDGTLQGMTPCSHRSSKGFFSFLSQSQLLQVASKTIDWNDLCLVILDDFVR